MKKNVIILIAIVFAVAMALTVLAGTGYGRTGMANSSLPETMEPVTAAYSPFESSGLFLVALDRQSFARNGLNLTLYRSDSGAAALDDMLNGKADLAVSVSEFPFVQGIFQGAPAYAVASIDRTEYIYIVARKDRGIVDPSDLRGKRVGTAAGSIAEFYLGRFLTLHGLSMQEIHYASVKTPPETAEAVVNGSLDAAVLAQPYADLAKNRLGGNATFWPAQSSQPLYALVVSTDGWITGHPDQTTRFLRSLSEAEEFIHTHPAEAQGIIRQRLNLSPEYMPVVWQQNQFGLTLDQSLVAAMEDEARWMIANNMTNATAVPDFRKFIYTDGLEAVRPNSVNIIR